MPRFYCTICKTSFIWSSKTNIHKRRFSWFHRWLLGANATQIAKSVKVSNRTILRTIYWYLDHPPKPNPTSNDNCYLVIDATWFKRESCIIVYWDSGLKKIQWWHYTEGERLLVVLGDLNKLEEKGVVLTSATSDGAKGIQAAVNIKYPEIPHQRCMVHLQRLSLALITRKPRTCAGQEIKPLVKLLSAIDTVEKKKQWIKSFEKWCAKHENFLKEKTYPETHVVNGKRWWYTHKSLRRVRALIANAIPNLFYYLDDENIPKTSNGLEGRFSSLKQHYRQHRGLSKKRREAYLAWYITVVVNKELPTRSVN